MSKLKFYILYATVIFYALYAQSPALDNYVALEDTSFSFYAADTFYGSNYTVYIIYMSSQSWRDSSEVDRTLWEHWADVIIPDNVYYDKALLFINGGSNHPNPPDDVEEELATIATLSNSIVIDFGMVPNEPLTFSDETESRTEDEIIAYTWDKFLYGGDETWILQLPMVKSVVKAMDMVQLFTAGLHNPIEINQFVLSGASKRGWTTWLTSAVDDRVCAMVPAVFDALNIVQSFKHHYGAYGFWAPAVGDYEEIGIFDWLIYPEIYDLMAVVDPLEYKDGYTLPKFLIHATGDEFFIPSSRFYFDELPGQSYQRYVPNASHGLDQAIEDVVYSLLAFYKAILNDYSLPEFSWEIQDDGSIRFESISSPVQVKLWQATNENAFDFRYMTIGPAWEDSILTDLGDGVYIAEVSEPDSGWIAFFIEAIYLGIGQFSYKFSSDVSFLPKTLPYAAEIPFTVNDPGNVYEQIWIEGEMTSGLPLGLHNDISEGSWNITIPIVIDGEYSFNVIGVSNADSTVLNDTPILFTVLNGQVSGETDFTASTAAVSDSGLPEKFMVHPAFPNPFNPMTTFRYDLQEDAMVNITIYDMLGRIVNNLVSSQQSAGYKSVRWNATNDAGSPVSAGLYLYMIQAGDFRQTKKMVLLK